MNAVCSQLVRMLLVAGLCLASNSALGAQSLFNVGDSVTAIKDTEIASQNQPHQTFAAGTTAAIKKIEGAMLLVDTDPSGWVPAENVVAFDKAVPYFSALIEHSPKDPHNYYFRAGVWQTQGKFDLAIKDYDEAIRLDPKQAAYYPERGGCYLAKKDYPHAIADFSECMKLQPTAINAYLGRGGVYCDAGDYEKAIADWKTAVRLAPQSVTPRACLVELLACCPDVKYRRGALAVKFATTLCQETDWHDSQMLHYLACAYAETADFESAVKWEKQAIAVNPRDRALYLANFQKALALFESQKPLHELMDFVR